MSSDSCDSCKKQKRWKDSLLCMECVEQSIVRECVMCGRGPTRKNSARVTVKQCSACKSQFYCSEMCQRLDYIFHKNYCPDLERLQKELLDHYKTSKECFNCSKFQGKPKRCSGCKTICYCDSKCQNEGNREHKLVCKTFELLNKRYYPINNKKRK